jgi:hypothetical protein
MAKRDAVRDNDSSWLKQPYGVILGEDYKSYRTALFNALTRALEGSPSSTGARMSHEQAKAKAKQIIKQNESDNNGGVADPYQYLSPRVSDASLGGNDVINPYSAFALDDDIVHDAYMCQGTTYGMGRVYNEIYESKQQVLYLTMGVPKYNNLDKFFMNANDKIAASMVDNGYVGTAVKLGSLLAKGIALAIELPWLPIIWAKDLLYASKKLDVTEYFHMYSTMTLYYRTVNTLLSHLAVNMGLYGAFGSQRGANMPANQLARYSKNLPEIMKDGPDIFTIMNRRAARLGKTTKVMTTDELIKNCRISGKKFDIFAKGRSTGGAARPGAARKPSVWNKFTGALVGTSLAGNDFVGFRVEKSTDASESFSNSTKDSQLGQQLNGQVDANRTKNLGEFGKSSGALAFLKNTIDSAKQGLDAIFSGSLKKMATYVSTSNGYFDLPKSWSGSSFSRSYSFTMRLRARTGGDNVSIFQSCMVPTCMLLATTLPRGVGDSTYSSPFIVRAFCKGMFSIPAGVITTLSIKRGDGEFGWSINKLPTVIDIQFSIEDLSPILFISLAGEGSFLKALSNNTKLQEYLSTLSGIGLRERYFRLGQIRRKLATALLINKNTTFSSTYWGTALGDSQVVKAITAITPWDRVQNN